MPVTIDGTTGISGPASGLTDLNASNLSTGTVPDARFPATLPAVSGANLTALNASNLGSGTVPDARFPATLPAASGANLTALNASNLSSGTVPDARFPATLPAASGANLTNLNASNISSGTVAVANGGTGATTQADARANLGTVADAASNGIAARTSANTLTARTITAGTGISVTNGDGVAGNPTVTNSGVTSIVAGSNITISGGTGAVTINAASSAPTTAQVLSATAGASVGAVGTYAFCKDSTNATLGAGNTRSGSVLQYSNANAVASGTPSGTWRLMGYLNACGNVPGLVSLWLRIS